MKTQLFCFDLQHFNLNLGTGCRPKTGPRYSIAALWCVCSLGLLQHEVLDESKPKNSRLRTGSMPLSSLSHPHRHLQQKSFRDVSSLKFVAFRLLQLSKCSSTPPTLQVAVGTASRSRPWRSAPSPGPPPWPWRPRAADANSWRSDHAQQPGPGLNLEDPKNPTPQGWRDIDAKGSKVLSCSKVQILEKAAESLQMNQKSACLMFGPLLFRFTLPKYI